MLINLPHTYLLRIIINIHKLSHFQIFRTFLVNKQAVEKYKVDLILYTYKIN